MATALAGFRYNQRVTIIDPRHPMQGAVGTVRRLMMADNGAWVTMDTLPPPEVAAFPADDPGGREKNIILYPDQCATLASSATAPAGGGA